jgi:hypothetical protein
MTPKARRAAAFDLGIVFRIDPALLKHISERAACTPLAVAKVQKFLTDERASLTKGAPMSDPAKKQPCPRPSLKRAPA